MKKKILLVIVLISFCFVSVSALTPNFKIDYSKLSKKGNNKTNDIVKTFNKDYSLTSSISTGDAKLEEEIKELTKKTTYLLLGKMNGETETSEEYYNRHKEYLKLRYNPKVPKDENSPIGLDQNSQEYKDDLVSGMSVPSIFLQIQDLGIIYNSYGEIRITDADPIIISSIVIPNIKIRGENEDNPMEFTYEDTNLIMYYYFKKLDGEYKLYYLFGQTDEKLENYLKNVEDSESDSGIQAINSYESELSNIYSFEKLENMSDDDFNRIYDNNVDKVVYLSSIQDLSIINSANGFFISDGLIVTTWSFIEESLQKANGIVITGNGDKAFTFDGIVTANPNTNIVVIKVKERNTGSLELSNSEEVNKEDPAIMIGSKSGIKSSIQKGIVTSNNGYIETSIPISKSDQGSPLFDKDGKLIGMTTPISVNSNISVSISSNTLKEVQDKFTNMNIDEIQVITFEELKDNYYYNLSNDEKIKNSISKSKWKKYSKIGNVSESIPFKLVKASYEDNIVSLRYKNSISNFVSSIGSAKGFIDNLVKQGYKNIFDSETKLIYQNKDYKVIIMEEFDYLIIVMVKL